MRFKLIEDNKRFSICRSVCIYELLTKINNIKRSLWIYYFLNSISRQSFYYWSFLIENSFRARQLLKYCAFEIIYKFIIELYYYNVIFCLLYLLIYFFFNQIYSANTCSKNQINLRKYISGAIFVKYREFKLRHHNAKLFNRTSARHQLSELHSDINIHSIWL